LLHSTAAPNGLPIAHQKVEVHNYVLLTDMGRTLQKKCFYIRAPAVPDDVIFYKMAG